MNAVQDTAAVEPTAVVHREMLYRLAVPGARAVVLRVDTDTSGTCAASGTSGRVRLSVGSAIRLPLSEGEAARLAALLALVHATGADGHMRPDDGTGLTLRDASWDRYRLSVGSAWRNLLDRRDLPAILAVLHAYLADHEPADHAAGERGQS